MTMSEETEILSQADEFAALLPWYVTGKITDADRAKVEAYLAAHPQAREQLAVAREEADVIFTADAGIEVPHTALDKLMASVAASPSARLHSAGGSLLERFGSFLAGLAPRQLAYSTLAAALGLVLLAGAVGMRLGSTQPGYEVATDPSRGTQAGTFALVSFQPAAPAATVSAFLADNTYAIVDGPRAGGIYRIRISETVLSTDEAEAALAKIKARSDLISFASAAPAN